MSLSIDPERVLAGFGEAIASDFSTPLPQADDSEGAGRCFRALLPLCRRAGISRIADLTGLDRLSLPVVQAVRPGALSEVTSLGRGQSITEAAVGAVMESLERYYAESMTSDRIFLASADELKVADGLFENLLVPGRGAGWRRQTIQWITALDIFSGSSQVVPLELVHTRYTDPPPDHDGLFLRTTAGLACHMAWHLAVAHGIYECIERDAIARAFATHGFFDRMRIAPFGLGKAVDDIMVLLVEHGISVGFWHAVSPTGVAVVWCQTIEIGRGEPILALPTEGYSAGPNLEAAASSALLEALATRAGAISGARDDQTTGHYRKRTDAVVAKARQLILDQTPFVPVIESGPISNIRSLIDRVVAAGLGPALAVPIGTDGGAGVHCVRIILPGGRPFTIAR